jgi:hypothetical protein
LSRELSKWDLIGCCLVVFWWVSTLLSFRLESNQTLFVTYTVSRC